MFEVEKHLDTNNWFNYPDFYDFIVSQKDINTVAEIGVWKGNSISYLVGGILRNGRIPKAFAIDIWEKWEFEQDLAKEWLEEVRNIRSIYEENLRRANVRQYIADIERRSVDASKDFSDGFFDMVFIDGNHNYGPVKQDIECWLPKVRAGGILAGHDYNEPSCGAKQAVDEIFPEVNVMNQVWFIRK